MSDHSKEPWTFDGKTVKSGKYPIVDLENICSRDGMEPGAIANAARIVACVNAMDGIADPGAIQRLVEAAERARDLCQHSSHRHMAEIFKDLDEVLKALRPETRTTDG